MEKRKREIEEEKKRAEEQAKQDKLNQIEKVKQLRVKLGQLEKKIVSD